MILYDLKAQWSAWARKLFQIKIWEICNISLLRIFSLTWVGKLTCLPKDWQKICSVHQLHGHDDTNCILSERRWLFTLFWTMEPEHGIETNCTYLVDQCFGRPSLNTILFRIIWIFVYVISRFFLCVKFRCYGISGDFATLQIPKH